MKPEDSRVFKSSKGWIIEQGEIVGVTVEDIAEIDLLYYAQVRWDTDRNKVTSVRPYKVLISEEEVETEIRQQISTLKRNMAAFKSERDRERLEAGS